VYKITEGLFSRKPKLPEYDGSYGNPVSKSEIEKIKDEHKKTIQLVKNLIKSALPGCKLSNEEMYVREKEHADGIVVILMSQRIVSIKDNYKILQKQAKGKLEDSFEDADGNDKYDILEKIFFNKLKKEGFNEEQTGLYSHKKYEFLMVDIDSGFDDLIVSFEYAYKKEN
jgi:hypothetical protein